jgi:hypothetical protein
MWPVTSLKSHLLFLVYKLFGDWRKSFFKCPCPWSIKSPLLGEWSSLYIKTLVVKEIDNVLEWCLFFSIPYLPFSSKITVTWSDPSVLFSISLSWGCGLLDIFLTRVQNSYWDLSLIKYILPPLDFFPHVLLKMYSSRHQGLMPIIIATQEAEIRRITVLNQPRTNSSWDRISKSPITKWGWWSGSSSRSACLASVRFWVQIPVPLEKNVLSSESYQYSHIPVL